MDHQRFDQLTKLLAARPSRRTTLRGLAGAAASVLGVRAAMPAAAQEVCPTECDFSSDCCEGYFCFVGVCDNVCHGEGERCYTGDVCCAGMACFIDSTGGVDETGFLPGTCLTPVCGETGAECQFPADCCEGFGCFFEDGVGTCGPTTCFDDGEACSHELECCGDSVCEEAVCCVTFGQHCWSANACCGGVECVGFDTENEIPGYCGACDDSAVICRGDRSCCPGSVCVEGSCVPAEGTCAEVGGSCASDTDCCDGLYCEISGDSEPGDGGENGTVEESGEILGTCQVVCAGVGDDCAAGEDCCGGSTCVDGTCTADDTPSNGGEEVDNDSAAGDGGSGTTDSGEEVTTLPATGAGPEEPGLSLGLIVGGAVAGATAWAVRRGQPSEQR